MECIVIYSNRLGKHKSKIYSTMSFRFSIFGRDGNNNGYHTRHINLAGIQHCPVCYMLHNHTVHEVTVQYMVVDIYMMEQEIT